MRDFASQLYSSKAWQDCREAYKRSKRGLCEECLAKGIYNAGEIVHHKKHLTPQNINDPAVTLSWDNLELVCRDCHAKIHGKDKRYRFDQNGRCVVNFPGAEHPLLEIYG